MSLIEQIDKDVKQALKAGEKERTTVLRGLKSELKYRRIDKGDDLTEDDVIFVLAGCAKKVRESLEQFRQGGREDLVSKAQFELDIIHKYLPKQLTKEELRQIIELAIEETGADSPSKIGLVMKAVMPKVRGKANGKTVNRLVSEILVAK